jgi:hypothetical protein
MFFIVADGEQAAMDGRMQRLDAAVHDLGKAGDVRNVPDGYALRRDRLRRAAGGDQLDASRMERAGQLGEPRLVGDRKQSAAWPDEVGGGDVLRGDGHDAQAPCGIGGDDDFLAA